MTAIAAPPLPAPSAARRRRLAIATTGDPDVLLRVLTLLRRRGFQVLSVDFRAGDRHAPPVLRLTVEACGRTAHRLEPWLLNVVGVVAVGDAWGRT